MQRIQILVLLSKSTQSTGHKAGEPTPLHACDKTWIRVAKEEAGRQAWR